MEMTDPATGQPLPADAIQRVLFIAAGVHVYQIPPMVQGKGHVAGTWTSDPSQQIFTARLRIMETAIPQNSGGGGDAGAPEETLKTDIVLEDSANGQLFAAAPYTSAAVVEPASDSSRFFALRVQNEAGHKATLGIGFEERSPAFDFSVALQEARKTLGWEQQGGPAGSEGSEKKSAASGSQDSVEKQDFSLKEGETITVNLPGRFGRRRQESESSSSSSNAATPLSSFALPPPPSGAPLSTGAGILPPPPPAPQSSSRAQRASSQSVTQLPSAKDLGFDDGKFGEFA